MNRLAPLHAFPLLLESPEYPLHIASLMLFRPPDGAGPALGRETYEAMGARSDVAPIFASHPAPTRRGTSNLRWCHDGSIDIDFHLRYESLPTGGKRELFESVSRIHSRHLDRHKPLWEAHLIDGLNGGRFAVYIKLHHALFDGITGMKLLRRSLSTDPDDHQVRVVWSPESNADEAREAVGQEKVAEARESVSDLGRSVSMLRAWLREHQLVPLLRAPHTMFNVPSGGAQCCAGQSWPLQRIKDVTTAAGVTVNDVALAMIAGALRTYLTGQNALPDAPLVALVAFNLRTENDALGRSLRGLSSTANIMTAAPCNLATHLDNPAERLETIHASMLYNKQVMRALPRPVAIGMAALMATPNLLSSIPSLSGLIPPLFNIVFSSVSGAGVQEPLYYNGARLEANYPLMPTLRGQALNFALAASANNLDFGIVGSSRAVPHLERLQAHLETSLKDMERAVGL